MLRVAVVVAHDLAVAHLDARRRRRSRPAGDPGVHLLERGVLGFIPKAYSPEVMLSAVRLVLAGGVYVPPMMLSAVPPGVVAGASAEQPVTGGGRGGSSAATLDTLRNVLTERQVAKKKRLIRHVKRGK